MKNKLKEKYDAKPIQDVLETNASDPIGVNLIGDVGGDR
jgi:hypothetical protein